MTGTSVGVMGISVVLMDAGVIATGGSVASTDPDVDVAELPLVARDESA